MAISLGGLANATTSAGAISNLILVNPSKGAGITPQNAKKDGLIGQAINFLTNKSPSFFFHYEGENTATLQSDITDHYVEDNSFLQDHIALRPEQISVHGYIGEANNVPPIALEPLKLAVDKLTVLSAYKPALSASAIRQYNRVQRTYQAADALASAAVSAWNTVGNLADSAFNEGKNQSTVQNKQQKAFYQFYGYWKNRTLFTVQTPWAIFKDMAILNLRATQNEETNLISDFEITFKKIRFASTDITSKSLAAGRAATQAAGVSDKGVSTPGESDSLSQAFDSNYSGVL